MNLGLESDVSNPNFAGAVSNPDKLLHVEFYMFEPLDQHKSQIAGKRVYQTVHIPDGPEKTDKNGFTYQPMKDTGERVKVPYIRIMKPGDNTSILELPVREDHKRRWPEEWLYFASQEGLIDSGANIPGWKIEEWTHINGDLETIRNLKYLRFHTVEQIAGASDAQCQKLGMGGYGLRDAAKKALQERVRHGISQELAAKDAEIEKLKSEMAKFAEFMTQQQNQKPTEQPPAQPAETPKKRGRPRKVIQGGEQHTT